MQELVILTGIPGTGKSTVAELAIKGTGYNIVNYGTVITQALKQDGHIETPDDIRAKLNQNVWVDYQQKAAQNISKSEGRILLTTHSAFASPHGYFPGLPFDILQEFRPAPKAIVIIEAPIEQLQRRQKTDTDRTRGYDFESNISEFLEMNRSYAVAYSALTRARVKIINNLEHRVEKAAKELRLLLLEL